MVMPGAFAQSLAKRGVAGVRMLWQHDPHEPVGAWSVIREDARGLFVRGRLNLAVARARELLALMRQGALDGLSIGFKTETARADPRSGVRRLTRVDLWEISLVTFPLLPQARVAAVKSDPDAALAAALRRAASALRP
ncbi:HK97 family phage prohead protease [Alsobacter sp. SYSU M60028]|uniref:HK97 family phage prohead protease n=2 Tax=Alsobacter ponti TaxID=2962936 RepID=A0ABT1L8K8_9HYPH|nr:HK97 family phage prohead protease [Alsobacter ponti]